VGRKSFQEPEERYLRPAGIKPGQDRSVREKANLLKKNRTTLKIRYYPVFFRRLRKKKPVYPLRPANSDNLFLFSPVISPTDPFT
jgi:hypothetical protein